MRAMTYFSRARATRTREIGKGGGHDDRFEKGGVGAKERKREGNPAMPAALP